MKLPKRGLPSASSPVRASTVTPKLRSVPALVMKAFCPLSTHPPDTCSALVRSDRTSEPAPGSVSPNAPSCRPSASGRSHRSRCSSSANSSSGRLPMVQCACQAVAIEGSTVARASSRAT